MKSVLVTNAALKAVVEQVAEVAGYLWQKGWAERNGGNITVNITEQVGDTLRTWPAISDTYHLGYKKEIFEGGVKTDKVKIGFKAENLKGCYFYAKGTNMRMRDLARWPMDNGAIIRISEDGETYDIIADKAIRPTSEITSHLAVHNYLVGIGSPYKACLHTHPIELVAMTHNKEFLEKDVLTNLLWSMIPETKAFCPRGLGIVPYMLPSSKDLADATIKTLKDGYDVVMWEKHGVLAVDTDIMSAFDQVDVLNKSTLIYIAARNMGFVPDGMSQEQLQEMTQAFGLPK